MGKYDKFFELAKKAGLKEAELYISVSHNLEVSLFHGEINNYSDNNSMNIVARGINKNGKCGSASCDSWDKTKPEFLVNKIVENSDVIENEDPIFIFGGSEKYHKISTYNKALDEVKTEDQIAKLYELEKEIKNVDKRIVEVAMCEFDLSNSKFAIYNSKGLKLEQKSNYFVYVGQCVAKNDAQTKSGFDYCIDNDFSKLDIKKLANKIANNALDLLGGEPCESKKYKVVLSPDVVSNFLRVYAGYSDAEEVQKHSSLFCDKLHTKIASSKVTIEDKPLVKNMFARWFDDEGVATYNKAIIKKGVLETYLYNLTTAAKDGVSTTGNALGAGSKKGAGPIFLTLKPGNKSQKELFEKIGDGVYITDVSGLHSGLNPQSGAFSLQSNGFLIKDGKKDKPLDLITLSGNLMELFADVVEVGNDSTIFPSGVCCSSLLIKKLSVSGK